MKNYTKLLDLINRMQQEDKDQRDQDLIAEQRWRSIPRETAQLLSIIARSCNAKNIVEIGASHGFSTLWLGLVAKSLGGKVTSFEVSKWRYEQALINIKEAELEGYVDIFLSDIKKNPENIPENVDLIFLDAEKNDYLDHFKILYDKLREGGIVIADNAVSHREELQEYINYVKNHENCNSVLIPIGRGLEVTYKFIQDERNKAPWNKLF